MSNEQLFSNFAQHAGETQTQDTTAITVTLENSNKETVAFELSPQFAEIFAKKIRLSVSAKTVLEKRYLKKDDTGKVIEQPEDLFRRVAFAIAEAEKKFDTNADTEAYAAKFYEMMIDRDFMPNSPTLMNAGRHIGQLSACFVLPVDDSIDSIFETIKYTALIHKSGGGTGFSFSRLRPKNDVVRTTAGVSSGPVSFIKVFDAATEAIKQGGTRRGANMGILRIDHPDILEFIESKKDLTQLTNFNISVALTEKFMQAVIDNTDYELLNPRSKAPASCLSARKVFDLIVRSAWETGEPGIIFLDRINRDNPTPNVGEIESTNPCGEQPLLPYESCNLGSINLCGIFNNKCERNIDLDKLARIVRTAVRFLDDVIEVNRFPLPQIEEQTKANRKIGLGIMGFADLLFKLGIPYNSQNAVDIAADIMRFINETAHDESAQLAIARGAYKNFPDSRLGALGKPPERNATVTTIAPTGTISIIAGASSGIEPLFALAFVRNVLGGQKLFDVNPVFLNELSRCGAYTDDIVEEIIKSGTLASLSVPDELKRVFVTAHDITPEWHIRLQAAFQAHTDNAVSKTVNFPNSATVDDIREGYILAYNLSCKGVTVYRDGSRTEQVLTHGSQSAPDTQPEAVNTSLVRVERSIRTRPDVIQGMTFKVATGCGSLYVTVNEDADGPFEVFAHLGKTGGCAASQSEALSRLVSLALRSGVAPDEIIKQIKGIRCPSPFWNNGGMTLSCPDGIGKTLETAWRAHAQKHGGDLFTESEPIEHSSVQFEPKIDIKNILVCPECGSVMFKSEGCATCPSCGFSKCS